MVDGFSRHFLFRFFAKKCLTIYGRFPILLIQVKRVNEVSGFIPEKGPGFLGQDGGPLGLFEGEL